MAIEHITVYMAPDSTRREIRVGEYGVQWIAVGDSFITVSRDDYTQVFPLVNVSEYVIWKRS
jgi:hypothetical protein